MVAETGPPSAVAGRVCQRTGKLIFNSEARANKIIARIVARDGYDPSLHAFRCQRHWHIGHNDKLWGLFARLGHERHQKKRKRKAR